MCTDDLSIGRMGCILFTALFCLLAIVALACLEFIGFIACSVLTLYFAWMALQKEVKYE